MPTRQRSMSATRSGSSGFHRYEAKRPTRNHYIECGMGHQNRGFGRIVIGIAAAAGPIAALPAVFAAEAETTGIEEVVVTAQFRQQNLQDTPLAITAMSGGMLEARSQNNISE